MMLPPFHEPRLTYRPHISPYQSSATTREGLAKELEATLEAFDDGMGHTLSAVRHGLCGPFTYTAIVRPDSVVEVFLGAGWLTQGPPAETCVGIAALLATGWSWPEVDDACDSCQQVAAGLLCAVSLPWYSLAESGECIPFISRTFDRSYRLDAISAATIDALAICCGADVPDGLHYRGVDWPATKRQEPREVDPTRISHRHGQLNGEGR